MSLTLGFQADFVTSVVEVCRHLLPDDSTYVPEVDELATVLHAALWASIQRDEDRQVVFSVSISPKRSPSRVLALQRSLELSAEVLLKLAVATTAGATAVHVGLEGGQVRIFGLDTLLGTRSPVSIEVRGPATLVVKAGASSVAVVAGRTAALIDRSYYRGYRFASDTDQLDVDARRDREQRLTLVVRAMLACGHGGTILIVPASANVALLPLDFQYPLEQAFPGLRDADDGVKSSLGALSEGSSEPEIREAHGDFRTMSLLRDRYASAVGRTTNVDGATVLLSDGSLIGFGAKIRSLGRPVLVHRLRPIEGATIITEPVEGFGGTRHQSAARFVAEAALNMPCYAVVASQDGRLSILTKDEEPNCVTCLEHAEWLF